MTDIPGDALWCAPGFHMAAVDRDVVVLDVAGDRYHCLPGLADHLSITGDGRLSCRDDALRSDLLAAGLASRNPVSPPRSPIQAARREIEPTPPASRADIVRAAASLIASTAAFRGRTLADLIAHDATTPPSPLNEKLLSRLTGAARIARPWIPFEGECLQRSFQLRRMLARWDIPVDWIFGVRTWPFGAHCWLQAGDLVIGDRLTRVRRYTPIMRA